MTRRLITTPRARLPLLACALASIAGCSSSNESWGVDGSKPVSTLDTAEARIACEAYSDYLLAEHPVSEQIRLECLRRGLQSSIDEAGCQASLDACVADPPSDVTCCLFDGIDCTSAMASATCAATVSSLEACGVAVFGARGARDAELDCSLAGNFAELERLSQPLPTPAECSALDSTCPITEGDELGSIRVALAGG